MSEQIQVVGQIVSGRGLAKKHVLHYQEELRAITQQNLYPGTLNILLNLPLRLRDAAGYQFGSEGTMVWPAFLFGVEVWICRWPSYPLHVVEILSSVHLRERFNLTDGDDVTISLNEEQTAAINPLGWIAWLALWVGRRKSFYLRDTCFTDSNRTMIWSKKLGAQQLPPEVKGARQLSLLVARKIIKETPILGGWITRRGKTKTSEFEALPPATASHFNPAAASNPQAHSKL